MKKIILILSFAFAASIFLQAQCTLGLPTGTLPGSTDPIAVTEACEGTILDITGVSSASIDPNFYIIGLNDGTFGPAVDPVTFPDVLSVPGYDVTVVSPTGNYLLGTEYGVGIGDGDGIISGTLLNLTCTPEDQTFIITPIIDVYEFDGTNGTNAIGSYLTTLVGDPAVEPDCTDAALTGMVTVYPILTAVVVDNGASCGTAQVDLIAADGATVCDSQTLACVNDGDMLNADFSAAFLDPLLCSALTSIVNCANCSGPPMVTCAQTCADVAANDCGNNVEPNTTFDGNPGAEAPAVPWSGNGSGIGCQSYGTFDGATLSGGLPSDGNEVYTHCTQWTATLPDAFFPTFIGTIGATGGCFSQQTATVYDAATCTDVNGVGGIVVDNPPVVLNSTADWPGFASAVTGLTVGNTYIVCYELDFNAAGTFTTDDPDGSTAGGVVSGDESYVACAPQAGDVVLDYCMNTIEFGNVAACSIGADTGNDTAYCFGDESIEDIGTDLGYDDTGFDAGVNATANAGVAFVEICGEYDPALDAIAGDPRTNPNYTGFFVPQGFSYSGSGGASATGCDPFEGCDFITLVSVTYIDIDPVDDSFITDPVDICFGNAFIVGFIPEIVIEDGPYDCATGIDLDISGGSPDDGTSCTNADAGQAVAGDYTISGDVSGVTPGGIINFSDLADGTYNYTVTDPFGCETTGTFDVTGCVDCTADAGTLAADAAAPCVAGGEAAYVISATPNGDSVVPTDYDVTYVLTSGAGLVIEAAGATPSFDLVALGLPLSGVYTIHCLVAETSDAASADYLDLSVIVFGTTTGGDVLGLLAGICGSLDAVGAPFDLQDCDVDCEISVEIINTGCTDPNNTPEDTSDDVTTYSITVIDVNGTGTTFTITGAMWYDAVSDMNMTATIASGTYGVPLTVDDSGNPLSLEGIGTITVNINDNDTVINPDCIATDALTIGGCGMTNIPTLSQWGLMSLALLLMIFGAIKLGSVNITSLKKRA